MSETASNTTASTVPGILSVPPIAEVVPALRSHDPGAVASRLGLSLRQVVSSLAWTALGDHDDPRLPLVQHTPPEPRIRAALEESAWAPMLPNASPPARLAFAAGLLLIFDFWEPSHEAAQEADDQGEHFASPYWHGIAHRREPDPGNAGYWFRRVGKHPLFAELGALARPLIESHGDRNLLARLTRGGFDPYAMIDLCTTARPGSTEELLARRLQRIEAALLLEACLKQVEQP